MENLANRGCPLRSIVGSPGDVVQRFTRLGFAHVQSELLSHFDPLIVRRNPEIIDELEEYNLLQSHYAFTIGGSGPTSSVYIDSVFSTNDNPT